MAHMGDTTEQQFDKSNELGFLLSEDSDELRHEKTNVLHMRKQRRRSASR